MNRTDHAELDSGRERRIFTADVTAASMRRDGFDLFRREWDEQIGEPFPLPPFNSGRTGEFRARVHAAKVHDAAIVDVYGESIFGTLEGALGQERDWALMHVVQSGHWSYERSSDRSEMTASVGQFIVRHVGWPSFEAASRSRVKALILPASYLRPLIGDAHLIGSVDSAEVRVLMAHANTVAATLDDLESTGVQAAHSALVELFKGVLRQAVDGNEPRLAPALAQAAKSLADRRLTDPDLSPAMLARELDISVRTLHRAFAAGGESVAAYIRHSRLEQARRELSKPRGGLNVSELAACYQFADSSHFIRAFRKRYGQTPGEFARQRTEVP
jgi:AraC family transcriptional regulator, positive regulator of tynA and feaB